MRVSSVESPSEGMIDPKYLNSVAFRGVLHSLIIIVVRGAILLLRTILLMGADLHSVNTRSLSSVVVCSCNSSFLQANRRLLITLPLIDIVPWKLCRASWMIFSRYRLNSTCDKRHPWRTQTAVRNDCPISPSCSASCSVTSPSSMLYHRITRQSPLCYTRSNAFLKSMKL